MDMRGLAHFIRDVRKATSNQQEQEDRVDEELAKIRAKFIDTCHMSTYDRKKYVCKLMFISMLGYPITFGHMEGIRLMAEESPSEKLIGYLSASVLLNENSELLTLTTHTVYRDLASPHTLNRSLALAVVANTGGKEFAETMHDGVQNIILDDNADMHVRKKALLTLLHIYQKYPEIVDLARVVPKAAQLLVSSQDGVSMCAVAFLHGCISASNEHLYKGVPAKLIEILARIILERQTEPGYVYYGVPAPWLQCKVLRFLRYFPLPKDTQLRDRIILILRKMIKATEKVLKDAQTQQKQRGAQNRVSVMNAVLVEVASLVVQWNVGANVISECANVISSFIGDKREANQRYIGLTLLTRFSLVKDSEFDFQLLGKQYQQQIIVSLHDPDVSIRQKALGVLVAVCNQTNANEIIKELQTYLPIAGDSAFQATLVLSIALLTEKYCDDDNTYVDVMLTIVAQAGDMCPAEIAYRAVQMIVNNPPVQKRATTMVFNAVRSSKHIPQLMVRVTAFLLGEFGYQIALNPESTPHFQFNVLHAQLEFGSEETQGVILNAFFKFYNLYDDASVRERIMRVLCLYKNNLDPELQQRAAEYVALLENGGGELVGKILEPMPAFPDSVNSTLENIKKMHNIHDLWSEELIAAGVGRGAQRKSANAAASSGHAVVKLTDLSTMNSSVKVRSEEVRHDQLDALFSAPSKDSATMRQKYEQLRSQFTSLLAHRDGVLFSNADVEVRCSVSILHADCRLALSVSSKTTLAQSASVEILGTDGGLLLQSRVREGEATPLVVDFAARSLAVFPSSPSIRLSYRVQGAAAAEAVKTLSLPIACTSFISPYGTTSMEDSLQLYDSIQRTTTPLSRTITSQRKQSGKEAAQQVLSMLGYHCFLGPEGRLVGLGAHATQPRDKVLYAPIACEVASTTAAAVVTVYASDPCLQTVAMEVIEMFL